MSIYASITGRSTANLQSDLSPETHNEVSAAIDTVVLQDVGMFPLPWVWTEVPGNGIIADDTMRPLLRLSTDHSSNIQVTDGRFWLDDGVLNGDVEVAAECEFTIQGGHMRGNVVGDVYLTSGALFLTDVQGSVWQSGGTLVVNTASAVVSNMVQVTSITLADELNEGSLQATSINTDEISVAADLEWELIEANDGDHLHLVRTVAEPASEPTAEPTSEPKAEPTSEPSDQDNDDSDDVKTGMCGVTATPIGNFGLLIFCVGLMGRRRR